MIKDECTNCHKIYETTYAELSKSFVSHCPSCKSAIWQAFHQAVADTYTKLKKVGE